jgi:hypothetical protein
VAPVSFEVNGSGGAAGVPPVKAALVIATARAATATLSAATAVGSADLANTRGA